MIRRFFLTGILGLAIAFAALPVRAGQFTLGAQYDGWNSNYLSPFEGYEIWFPMSFSVDLDKGLNVFGRAKFELGHYTDSYGGTTQIQDLSAMTDSILGFDLRFKSFSLPSVFNIAVALPTGDTAWEGKQVAANIPIEFVNSRYQARGFGVNAYYGFEFATGGGSKLGAIAGYQYSGGFDPLGSNNPSPTDLNMGDALFLAFSQIQPFRAGVKQVIRLSGYYYLSTQENGVDVFRQGPIVNGSYAWVDPNAFSFEVGGAYFLPSQRSSGGPLVTEDSNFYGPRLYLVPSYVVGDLTLGARFKYIFPNGYSDTEALHTGGGMLFGFEPSLRMPLDIDSSLRIDTSLSDIIVQDAGYDSGGDLVNANYLYWTFGVNYEVKL